MPKLTIERTLVLQAYLPDEQGEERAVAKIQVDGETAKAWLAGREPVEMSIDDVAVVAGIFGAACVELGIDAEPIEEAFDPADPEEAVGEASAQPTTTSQEQGSHDKANGQTTQA